MIKNLIFALSGLCFGGVTENNTDMALVKVVGVSSTKYHDDTGYAKKMAEKYEKDAVKEQVSSNRETPSKVKRYFTLVLENVDYAVAMDTPYLVTLAKKGCLLTNFHANAHPSQPNYLHMIAGTDYEHKTDDVVQVQGPILPDLLEDQNYTWITYQQNYPGGCFIGNATKDLLYQRKHNPFISFASIRENATRCANIVNAEHLAVDIQNEQVPNYVFYTPNMVNDGHSILPNNLTEHERTEIAADWLSKFLEPLLANPYFNETLFVITFDESDQTDDIESVRLGSNVNGSAHAAENLIYTVLIGPGFTPGSTDDTRYTHHSGLAFLQKEWGLGSLGMGDVNATSFLFSSVSTAPTSGTLKGSISMTAISVFFLLAALF